MDPLSPVRTPHFELLERSSEGPARVGRLHTPHGSLDTPGFLPVGTYAAVRGLTPEELTAAGVQIVLCGQTAAARGIDRGRLQPGVKVALSAMTALFVFQEQGYRINLW